MGAAGGGETPIMPTLLKHVRVSSTNHPNQVCVRPEVSFILCNCASVKLDIMSSPNPSWGRQCIPKQERRTETSKDIQA